MNSLAEDFLKSFSEPAYPEGFLSRFEAMECLSSGDKSETLLIVEKVSGKLMVAKCYESGHPLYDSTEPEAVRRLSHHGLPAFEGEYRSETMRCIVRVYIPGKTLLELGKEAAFSPERVRSVGIALCEILTYLHRQTPPIIHRDIKPSNVIIRQDGSPALIDLGISRMYTEGAQADTVFCGTQDFSPPEQYGFKQTDRRSDIYALGILMAWMLTRKAQLLQTPRTPLERVIAKCTKFSPNQRFGDAAAVRRALMKAGRPSVMNRKNIPGVIALLIVLASAFGLWRSIVRPEAEARVEPSPTQLAVVEPTPEIEQLSSAGFYEPLIEEAVRLMLGKTADAPISADELAAVTELYITKDEACPDLGAFYQLHEEQCRKAYGTRGPITSLEDVRLLPNLRILCVASEQIEDISPLSGLKDLFQVELRGNDIRDISPFSEMKSLAAVGLNSNPVQDISPLTECTQLKSLDLCSVDTYDGSAMAGLGSLDFLDISNATDSYRYLAGKTITELKVSRTSLSDLSLLADVGGLKRLELSGTQLSELSGLENLPELEYINLSGISADDFGVLLRLPNLQKVTVSAAVQAILDPISAQSSFEIVYE